MKTFLLPYKAGSAGCRLLAERIGAKRIKLEGSRFRSGFDRLVVNWGNSRTDVSNPHWLNDPNAVLKASNKLRAFDIMTREGVSVPTWTDDMDRAMGWLEAGEVVVARRKLQGHSGEGIVVMEGKEDFVRAPLYTKYFKARDEYRVHVFDGKVIDIQQKKKRADMEKDQVNFQVRSHANGFNFCREGVDLPPECAEEAIKAVKALGLDFGAVDLRFNQHYNKACVLEVNTAPGLEGTTLDKYSDAVAELLQKIGV